MINENHFNTLTERARTRKYSSMNYIDFDDCKDAEILHDSDSLILLRGGGQKAAKTRKKTAFFFRGQSVLQAENTQMHPEPACLFPGAACFSVPVLEPDMPPAEISCICVPPEATLPPGWKAVPVRQALSSLACSKKDETGTAAAMLRAFHIAGWRQESVFCGSCGNRNADSEDGGSRICPACGRLEFPRICPAVIVLITNAEGRILLAHNRKFAPGMYSLIAGFAEAGETLENAAAREILEETGIRITGLRYVESSPWPFPNSLMLGFSARHESGDIKPDGTEIEDAAWFSPESLPLLPDHGSLARAMIDRWICGQQ